MTGSTIKYFLGGLFCLLLAGGAGQAAWAQSGESTDAQQEQTEEDTPRRLRLLGQGAEAIPEVDRDPASGPPVSIIPTPYVPRGALPLTRQSGDAQASGGIESAELGGSSPAGTGLPENLVTPVPPDLWDGLSAEIIALHFSLPRMPSRSAAVNRLAGDLARAPFFLPAGSTDGGPGQGLTAVEQRIIETRMRHMHALGLWSDLYAYWAGLPPVEPTGAMLRILAETLLMDGNLAAACQNVGEGRRVDGGPFWLELAALCAAFDASREQLEFFLELLREQGDIPVLRTDLFYDILSEAEGLSTRSIPVGEGPVMLDGLVLDPVALSAMAALGLEPPVGDAGALDPLLAKVLAERLDLPLDLRANAAIRAATFNLVDRRLVDALLSDMSFSSGERAIFDIVPGEARWNARRDGLLLEVARRGETPEEKLLAARLLWQRGLSLGTGHVLAPLIADTLGTVQSNPEDAAWVVPMALAGDDMRLARRWYSRLARAANGDAALETALTRLYPLVFLAGLEGSSPDDRSLENYLSLPLAPGVAEKTLAALEALHGPLDRRLWEQRLAGAPEQPGASRSLPFALWRELVLAEQLGLTGSMLSLSLAAAGAGPVPELEAAGLGILLHTLRGAGFEDQATAFALEALVTLHSGEAAE